MKNMRTALKVSLVVLPALMLVGCGGGTKARSTVDANIKNAKDFIADLKSTFESGSAEKQLQSDRPGRRDSRMGILTLLVDKIGSTITKRENDPAKRDKAIAQLRKAQDYLVKEIAPKYNAALQSRKPEDAKALVPMMDQLDKMMDELNNILNG